MLSFKSSKEVEEEFSGFHLTHFPIKEKLHKLIELANLQNLYKGSRLKEIPFHTSICMLCYNANLIFQRLKLNMLKV